VNSYTGPPMTLGNAAKAGVRLIVWCKKCQHQVEPDPAEQAQRLRRGDRGPGVCERNGQEAGLDPDAARSH
jgi:hypothetical protein